MSASPHELVFDVGQLTLVQPPRFVPPRLRVPYTHDEVQRVLAYAFDSMLPPLGIDAEGHAVYRWQWQDGAKCAQPQPLESLADIPAGEAMRMLQGFVKLHQLLATDQVSEGARSLLLNLRIPHPEKALEFYRKCPVGGDEERLLVLHGFECDAWPLLPMEDALGILMHASTLQVEEFAASMQATQRVALPPASRRPRPHWKWIASAAAAAAIVLSAILMRAPAAAGQDAREQAPARQPASTVTPPPPAADPLPQNMQKAPPASAMNEAQDLKH